MHRVTNDHARDSVEVERDRTAGRVLELPGALDRPVAAVDGVRGAVPVVSVFAAGYVVLTVTMIGLGLLVMEFVVDRWLGDIDSHVTHWLARNRSPVGDAIAAVVANLADTWTVVGMAVGAVSILLVEHHVRPSIVLIVGLPLELAVFLTVTYTVEQPRPDVPKLASVPATASFPSGHTTAAVVLYGGLALIICSLTSSRRLRAWLTTLGIAIPVAVGAARVYAGIHHPTDVVVGLGLGTGCLTVAVLATRSLPSASSGDGTATATEAPTVERGLVQ